MENIWFEYKSKSIQEIINNISSFSSIDYVVIITLVISTFLLLMYIFPFLNIYIDKKIKEIEKKKKKDKFKYLSLQNEIQTQIEKEFEEEDKAKIEERLKNLE